MSARPLLLIVPPATVRKITEGDVRGAMVNESGCEDDHNEVERRRKQRISRSIREMSELLEPQCRCRKQMTRSEILEQVLEAIAGLRGENARLEGEAAQQTQTPDGSSEEELQTRLSSLVAEHVLLQSLRLQLVGGGPPAEPIVGDPPAEPIVGGHLAEPIVVGPLGEPVVAGMPQGPGEEETGQGQDKEQEEDLEGGEKRAVEEGEEGGGVSCAAGKARETGCGVEGEEGVCDSGHGVTTACGQMWPVTSLLSDQCAEAVHPPAPTPSRPPPPTPSHPPAPTTSCPSSTPSRPPSPTTSHPPAPTPSRPPSTPSRPPPPTTSHPPPHTPSRPPSTSYQPPPTIPLHAPPPTPQPPTQPPPSTPSQPPPPTPSHPPPPTPSQPPAPTPSQPPPPTPSPSSLHRRGTALPRPPAHPPPFTSTPPSVWLHPLSSAATMPRPPPVTPPSFLLGGESPIVQPWITTHGSAPLRHISHSSHPHPSHSHPHRLAARYHPCGLPQGPSPPHQAHLHPFTHEQPFRPDLFSDAQRCGFTDIMGWRTEPYPTHLPPPPYHAPTSLPPPPSQRHYGGLSHDSAQVGGAVWRPYSETSRSSGFCLHDILSIPPSEELPPPPHPHPPHSHPPQPHSQQRMPSFLVDRLLDDV